jgi:predicted DNA-binding transcriptional regulator YafY
MNVKRITRLLKLLQMLQSGGSQNAEGLANVCGVSRRTLFRDLESLRQAGVPLQFDKEQECYSIPSSFFLPPTNFTAAEALSLIALAREMGRSDRLPFYEGAYAAAVKLEGSLPAPLRQELRLATKSIRIKPLQISRLEGKADVFHRLLDARARQRVVEIEYSSLTEWDNITTKLRPYHLLFSRHCWYVIGRSSLHAEIRTFNVARIAALKLLSQKYSIPRGFSLDRHLRNAWNMIPGPGKDYHVVVRFQPFVAHNVSEVVWHKTQQLDFQEDGSLEFRAKVSGLNEIVWWILGYGDQAEVLQPAKLRRMVAQRAENLVALYNGNNGQ